MGSGYKLISNKEALPIGLDKTLDTYFDKNKYKVTCGIPTRNRYDVLPNTLLSLVFQTTKPNQVIIVDDNDAPQDLRELQQYQAIFRLFDYYNIEWNVIYGRKMGQAHSHQIIQEAAKYPIIWRVDDDEVAEKNVLQGLLDHFSEDVGAVGGLVPQDCPPPTLPPNAENTIKDLNKPNIQWFKHPTRKALAGDKGYVIGLVPNIVEVDHLTSSYIYRKGIADFELTLSPASFREETLHTYEIKRKGYKLLVNPNVITWHFRSPSRHQNIEDWNRDDAFFYSKLNEWGIFGEKIKYVVLDAGKGDHCIIKKLIPELKKKYDKVIIASCFPDVFADSEIEQISIAEAQQKLGNLDRFNIYKAMIDWNWRDSLETAFRKLYEI